MLLEGSNASTVLTWVRPDLDKHLTQIRTQIEHIANSPHIGDAVENTAEHLTQLKYTFEALVLQGATLVVEEMITLCDELGRQNVRDRKKAFGAMMDAIVVVPSYLDRLQAGHHDLPILLLPVINELRAAYNANIVSEATLFAPSLDVPLPELERAADEHEPAFDEAFNAFAQRMCRQWETALLHWLQTQDNLELLSPLHSVCETMHRRVERLDLRRLWWIAAEVIGGLLDGVTDNDMHLRRLFARLHLTLKTLSGGGEDATDAQSIDSISQALLFHIAQAKPGSAGVDNLRERFHLQELVPDRDVLIRARGAVTGRNRELYISLGTAVRDELSLIKDALDLELRTGKVEHHRREQSHEALLRLKDTLKMMGLGDSAQSIEKLLPTFDASEDPDHDPDHRSRNALLMELAGELIQVESVLEEQITTLGEPLQEEQEDSFIDLPWHEQRRIRTHLLDETVVSLHQVQDGVRRHFDGDQKADYTTPMEHIAGAMELIGETETASLALKLRNALGNLLRTTRAESAISPEKLEAVTDAVAAFELYLAGCRDHQSNRGRFFEILKDRLDHLPVGEMEVVKTTTPAPAEDTATTETPDTAVETALDPEILEVFLEEFESVVVMLAEQIPLWIQRKEDSSLLNVIRRGFHTLKGSGRMVGANEIGDFSWHIEELLNTLLEGNIGSIDDVVDVVRLSDAVLPAMKKRLQQQPSWLQTPAIEAIVQQANVVMGSSKPDWTSLDGVLPASIAALLPGEVVALPESEVESTDGAEETVEPTLKELVCKELTTKLVVLKSLMDNISRDRSSTASEEELLAIHTIAGTTALDPLGREADIAKALEGFLAAQSQSGKTFTDAAMWTVATSLAHFETCLAVHEGDPEAELADDAESQIEQLLTLTVEFEVPAEILEEAEEVTSEEPEEEVAADASEDTGEVEEETEAEEELAEIEQEPVDTEILSIFLEEATDILERCDSLLNEWRDNLPDLSIVQNLQREIHTFKGGARMSGVSALGNLSHAMETLLERIAGQLLPPSVSAIEVLEQGCDRLNVWTEQAAQGTMPQPGEVLKLFGDQVDALTAVPIQPAIVTDEPARIDTPAEELLEIPDVVVPEIEPEAIEPEAIEPEAIEPEVIEPEETKPEEVKPTAGKPIAVKPSGEEAAVSQQIRVNADLLDSLVNSASEISIFRSRLEQEVSFIRENLKEFDGTVSRLREQFRKLEMETETQIRSTYQSEAPDGSAEFDPLELDRFSSIQQLSRSLSESVADLLNLQESLDQAARKSEALLVQQSRVSNELQEGLMQTRMVHFGNIAPRLRRIIRTAAGETRKKARLQLRMTDGGDLLDRNVLERITAPLEHLLRNSIVHGIEKPPARRKLKKPEEGQLTITVAAEATEFVVKVEDDGAGLNLQAIQKRAIAMGLIQEDSSPQPQQLLQLILNSGFSTSKTVTALAGRGVGMDVVNSEIKQIGGSVEIASEEGVGTCFTIRIPFTLAVMQAIGIRAGEHRYLIPVASVAGVARMLPDDYTKLLERDKPIYEFAGESYSILDLESLLGEPSSPLGDDTISMLMIKSGGQRAAFRVPELLGHREIVIKPVGPQISSVPGILGGSITSDGQVIIIIDVGPLIRQALLTGARPAPPLENIDIRPKKTLAMVADDSITMRKVTTRVLESHDFEVVTARDGMEATALMQERVPDILLLDVEMPRMNGYQVAEFVRADARLRQLPIVMITSRAGKKHRDRGMEAGANSYLSKPYKESELIKEVYKLLEKEMHQHG
jgi:chemosensory pili system protein ChpA (sensor histidine kinase/response regulator)